MAADRLTDLITQVAGDPAIRIMDIELKTGGLNGWDIEETGVELDFELNL